MPNSRQEMRINVRVLAMTMLVWTCTESGVKKGTDVFKISLFSELVKFLPTVHTKPY